MSQAQLVLIVPLGDLGLSAGQLPGGIAGIGGGHPGHDLPWSPGHPSHGLPGSPGHPANRPPNVPPNVVWPPSNPTRPDNSLPAWSPSGGVGGGGSTKPIQPPTGGTKPVDPGAALPAGASLVLVYNAENGWQGAVVDQSGQTKPIAPAEPK